MYLYAIQIHSQFYTKEKKLIKAKVKAETRKNTRKLAKR